MVTPKNYIATVGERWAPSDETMAWGMSLCDAICNSAHHRYCILCHTWLQGWGITQHTDDVLQRKKCWWLIPLYFFLGRKKKKIHILKSSIFFLSSLNNYHSVLTCISVLFLRYYQPRYNLHLVKIVPLGLLPGLCPLLESLWSRS